MKKLYYLFSSIPALLIYLTFCFGNTDFNIKTWDTFNRFFCSFLMLSSVIITFAYIFYNNDNTTTKK